VSEDGVVRAAKLREVVETANHITEGTLDAIVGSRLLAATFRSALYVSIGSRRTSWRRSCFSRSER